MNNQEPDIAESEDDIPSLATLLGNLADLESEYGTPPPAAETAVAPQKQINQFGFKAGGYNFLLAPGCYSEVLFSTAVSKFPNSPPFFAGLTNVRGNLLPVYHLEQAIGNGAQRRATKYILVIGKSESAVGVIVDELPKNLNLTNAAELAPLPNLPTALAAIVTTGYLLDGNCWVDFDHEHFFDHILNSSRCNSQ